MYTPGLSEAPRRIPNESRRATWLARGSGFASKCQFIVSDHANGTISYGISAPGLVEGTARRFVELLGVRAVIPSVKRVSEHCISARALQPETPTENYSYIIAIFLPVMQPVLPFSLDHHVVCRTDTNDHYHHRRTTAEDEEGQREDGQRGGGAR